MSPTKMAMEVVKWMKKQPAGTTFGYDSICVEIHRRWPELDDAETDFVFKKTIILFSFE